MAKRKDAKTESLQQSGSLYRRCEQVTDPLFQQSEFFDRRDLLQVKYEMLRSVRTDGRSVAEAARRFGFSRVAYYQTLQAFRAGGLPGLVRKKPGPRGPHKLSQCVVEFLRRAVAANGSLRARQLVRMVRRKFCLSVHPRTIERALAKREKKGP